MKIVYTLFLSMNKMRHAAFHLFNFAFFDSRSWKGIKGAKEGLIPPPGALLYPRHHNISYTSSSCFREQEDSPGGAENSLFD